MATQSKSTEDSMQVKGRVAADVEFKMVEKDGNKFEVANFAIIDNQNDKVRYNVGTTNAKTIAELKEKDVNKGDLIKIEGTNNVVEKGDKTYNNFKLEKVLEVANKQEALKGNVSAIGEEKILANKQKAMDVSFAINGDNNIPTFYTAKLYGQNVDAFKTSGIEKGDFIEVKGTLKEKESGNTVYRDITTSGEIKLLAKKKDQAVSTENTKSETKAETKAAAPEKPKGAEKKTGKQAEMSR